MHRRFKTYLLIALLLCGYTTAMAQDTIWYDSKKSGRSYKIKKAAEQLKKSLDDDDDVQAAKQYETLAQEFNGKRDYTRAEDYLKKARDIYSRLKKPDELAIVSRNLAKIQEAQNKIAPAIMNYNSAAGNSTNKSMSSANANDVRRLQSKDNPEAQNEYVQSNINLFEKDGRKEEAAGAYQQLAKNQMEQKDTRGAIESYQKGINVTEDPGTVAQLNRQIANAYVADNQVDKAVEITRSDLSKAKAQHDPEEQIDRLQDLAKLYAKQDKEEQAEPLLLQAYQLALKTNNTLKAKNCLTELLQYYETKKDYARSLELSRSFLGQLDTLIKKDSSLVDTRQFEITEGRIKELEQERQLQVELIGKTSRFNYFLIGSVAAMLLLVLVIARSRNAIKVKNKKIALQSLRREMNPHFIFNSLNSVNQYIAENNELEANRYLTSYSGLMRNMMENSNKDFVSLSTEITQLKKYLDLEQLRFRDKFEYTLEVAEELDTDAVLVPNMLIQPNLENAIWHGLRYKEHKGTLLLRFEKKDGNLNVIIKDDGIGLSKSQALKTVNQKAHQSRGLTNTKERISLLNDLYKTHIVMDIKELSEEQGGGTYVSIESPLMNKR